MRLVKILERFLAALPVLLGVLVIVFLAMRLLPGDPVEIMLADTAVSEREIQILRDQLHLDEPILTQFWLFTSGILQGDLGISVARGRPVADMLRATLPATIELTLATVILGILIAVPVGVISALKAGSLLDRAVMSMALLGVSMPAFWFGLLLILLFSVQLGWLPTSGRIPGRLDIETVTGFLLVDTLLAGDVSAFFTAIKHLILPSLTLGVVFAAIIARVVRSSMLDVLRMEYITAARARGVPELLVIIRHGLRNALIPAVTVAGLEIGSLLGGNMIVETVFGWPGVGRLAVSSIFARDYVVVQVVVMLYAATYVLANLVVDLVYTYLNPRIKL